MNALLLLVAVLVIVVGYLTFTIAQQPTASAQTIDPGGATTAQEPAVELSEEAKAGKALFKAQCNACHIQNRAATGPNLAGVQERWSGKEALLNEWIKNPSNVINNNDDPYVEAMVKEWVPKSGVMNAQLVNDEQIEQILAYIETW